MARLIDQDVDKRTMFDVENKCQVLSEKNKALILEIRSLRKQNDFKDSSVE